MIKSVNVDRLGAECCARPARPARSAHTASGAVATFGLGSAATMRQREARLVLPEVQTVFNRAPQTYLNGIVPPSAALHERSP